MATLTTQTTNFSKTVTDLIVRQVLDTLRAGLPHLPAEVAVIAKHVKGTNGTYRFIAYPDLDPRLDSLTEGVPFPEAEEEALSIEYDEFTAAQKGGVVRSSDLALVESPHDMVAQMTDKTTRQALETMDEIARLAWNTPVSGETVLRPSGVASQAAIDATNIITASLVRAAEALLAGRDVGRIGASASLEQGQVGGHYVAIAHPHVVADLQAETADGGWIDVARYAQPKSLLTGEVGMLHGVRFISSTRATLLADAGSSNVDVYRTFIAGRQAMAWADPTSLLATFIPPAPSAADPLGQVARAGWKAWVGGILTDAGAVGGRYCVIETAATLGANV